MNDALFVRHTLCWAAVNIHPQCAEVSGVVCCALVQWAVLGATEIHIKLVVHQRLSLCLYFFSRIEKLLVWVASKPEHTIPAFGGQYGVEEVEVRHIGFLLGTAKLGAEAPVNTRIYFFALRRGSKRSICSQWCRLGLEVPQNQL